MITSPWNTTVLRQHKLESYLSELSIAMMDGHLHHAGGRCTYVSASSTKVPPFVMPITSKEYGTRKVTHVKGGVVIDARSFSREDRVNGGTIIANQMQAELFFRMGDLTSLWVEDPTSHIEFLRVGDLAANVYTRWIGQAIVSKLGLDMEAARDINIVAATFYAHKFYSAEEALSEDGVGKISHMINRWTRFPLANIEAIVPTLPYMSHIEDFIQAIHSTFEHNARIKQINAGFLIMSLGNSWFGYGAREISAVAIEYPPVFLSLVEAACNTKVWKRTYLGQLVDRLNVSRAADTFLKGMQVLHTSAFNISNESYGKGDRLSSGVTPAQVNAAEAELGLKFDPAYRDFLLRYGCGVFGSRKILGLGNDNQNTVAITTDLRDSLHLRPNMYVMEGPDENGLYIVGDSYGQVHEVDQYTSRTTIDTQAQWLTRAVTGEVSQEAFDTDSDYGGTHTEQVTWWGGRKYTVVFRASDRSGGRPSPEQMQAYENFVKTIDDIVKSKIRAVIKFVADNHGARYSESDVFDQIVPKTVVFQPDGSWGILFDMALDPEHGMAIYNYGSKVFVGTQDDFL